MQLGLISASLFALFILYHSCITIPLMHAKPFLLLLFYIESIQLVNAVDFVAINIKNASSKYNSSDPRHQGMNLNVL